MSEPFDYLASAKRTIEIEGAAVHALAARLNSSFHDACELLLCCRGRVIVTGMGKSGHIARKIAATLASTGTPAFFVHPGEAGHGDLGMVTQSDVVIAISLSGSSSEILTLIPTIKRLGAPLVAMTSSISSPLGREADVHLDISVASEACPLDLAPTSSTTVTLVLGDCLAIALLEKRGFTAEDFAFSHPAGALGRKLLLRVGDVMRHGDQLPRCAPEVPLQEALLVMTSKGLGLALIVDQNRLLGIFTDGDLRRILKTDHALLHSPMSDLMTVNPRTTRADTLAAQALLQMQENRITSLVVLDDEGALAGILHLQDLLRAGVI